jgi:fatty-acyl-CoA synthase
MSDGAVKWSKPTGWTKIRKSFKVHAMESPESKDPMSYVRGDFDVPLLDKCIGQVLDDVAAKYPEQDCLVACHQNQRYSYRQFNELVGLAARGFLRLGIKREDRVGLWAPNCAEWVVVQFASARIGAILVNVNPANRAFELEHVLRQSECQMLLFAEGYRDINYVSTLQEICGDLALRGSGTSPSNQLPDLTTLIFLGNGPVPGTMSWSDFVSAGESVPVSELRRRESELAIDDAVNIQYTSGTTGRPKGAMLSHRNIANNGLLVANAMRFTHRDRLCIPVPFYHCFGMVLANMVCVASGATMVVPAASFDPLLTLAAVQEERCTALHGVPTMFIAELEHPRFAEFDLHSLRTGIMAGSPCPIEIMKQVVHDMHCRDLTIVYGLTESSPGITQTTPDDPLELRVATVGKVLPHTEVKIIDPLTQEIVPLGVAGELCTRGYHVMKGYYKNPEATKAAIDQEGWLHSGDLAVLDAQGYFSITGRAKDVIIRGGENIYPREVEEFLYTHPAISGVQIVGVPDRKFVEAVAAWVQLKPGCSLTLDELKAFCKGKIADFKIPRYLKIADVLPMTVTGKIQKYRIREMSLDEFGLRGSTVDDAGKQQ